MQDLAGLGHRREHATQVELGGAVAIFGGVGRVLGEQASGAVQRVAGGAGHLDTHAAVVAVGPVDQVIGSGTLLGSHPLGAGGLLQTEFRVEAADLDRNRREAVVGQGSFVEVAVILAAVATGVVREVVVNLVGPVGVHHTAQLEEGAAEVAGVGGVAVLGVEAIEAAVVSLDAAAQLEAECLVGGADFQATFGLDHDVGAVSGDGTGESLGGNGQSQGAGSKTGKVLHRRIPLLVFRKTLGLGPACWGGILAGGYFSSVVVI